MSFFKRLLLTFAAASLLAAPAFAQSRGAQPGTLRVVVADQLEAAIVGGTVRLTGLRPVDGASAAQAGAETFDQTVTTNDRGEAAFENLVPGKYALQAEFPGFEPYKLAELNVRRGQNRRTVTLAIAGIAEDVQVTRDQTDKGLTDGFSNTLTQEQIDALPDDEEEMAEMLAQMAGPGAQIMVNGFRGGRLPPKSQIQEIRFRFDPYAAEFHETGHPRVDIATRPGTTRFRGNANLTFRGDELNARNAFAPTKEDEQARRYQWSMDGPLVKGKSSFSLSIGGMDAYETEPLLVRNTDGEFRSIVTQPTDRLNVNVRVEHAINKAHVLRAEYQRNGSTQRNLGVGGFDLFDRAFTREFLGHTFRVSETGTFFGKARNELRVQFSTDDSSSQSLSDAVTVRVQDAFTQGGAQMFGGRRSKELQVADNFELPIAKNQSLRVGVLFEGSRYDSDEVRNASGTFTFASLDDYLLGRPLQFSRRDGNPLVEFSQWQFAWYVQDDIRLRKNLMLNVGVRQEAQTNFSDALNFAPRAFVTWSPFKNGTTTIRAGAGVFYDWFESSLYENTLRLDGARQRDIIIRSPGYPDPTSGGSLIALAPSVTRAAEDMDMPTVRRASIGLEHRFTSWMQIRANYFTQRGTSQFRSVNINAPVNGVRPDAAFGNISLIDSIGRSERQGLDVGAMLTYMPRRIMAGFNYSISRSRNDGDGATSLPVNGTDLAAQWAPSRDDMRHRFFTHVNLPLFKGFRVNTNVRFFGGTPYTITTGRDDNGDTVINDRPAGVGRNSARGENQTTVDLRLSWSRGFGKRNVDASREGPQVQVVQRPAGGGDRGGPGPGGGGMMMMMGGGPNTQNARATLELFVDASNVLNAVNYTRYSGVLTSPLFGQPLAAQAARRVEVGMRVGF